MHILIHNSKEDGQLAQDLPSPFTNNIVVSALGEALGSPDKSSSSFSSV